jgi:RsiW-degrading membrane proteinase PrsW (M82 family)
MNQFLLITLSVAPAIFIVAYFYMLDRHEREPLKMIVLCFIFGLISTYPALKMEEFGILDLYITASANPLMTFTFAFLIVAFSEELMKFIFLRYYIFTKSDFNEPMDGIVYSVSISMGFAAMENILHIVLRTEDFNEAVEIGYSRTLTAVPAHAAFAMAMGYFTGLAKVQSHRESLLLMIGFASAVFLHGLYDFFIFLEWTNSLTIYTITTLIIALISGKYLTLKHVHSSYLNSKKEP